MEEIKFLLAKIFGWELVWLECIDGEILLRKVYKTPFGKKARKIAGWCTLNEDGTATSYIVKWVKAN